MLKYPYNSAVGPLLLCALLALPCAGASLEESEVSQRMTRDATEFLDNILGAGKSRVLVTIEGESSEVHTETEIDTDITPPPQEKGVQAPSEMPGYNQVEEDTHTGTGFHQKDVERSFRRSSFRIKKAQVVIVIDESVSDEKVTSVRALLPQFLRLSEDRSDELVVLKASLVKVPWSTLWTTQAGVRTLLLIIAVSAVVLLVCMAGYLSISRAIRVLALLAERRGGSPAPAWPEPGREQALPDLLPGGLPSLDASTEEGGPASGALALGHRFDFLSSARPEDMAAFIAKESPSDLALLFAALAESHPGHAGALFALLPAVLQAETADALLKLDLADPERLGMLENRLRTAADFGVRGYERLGRILSRIAPDQRDALITDLMDRQPAAAEDLRRAIFPFEAIVSLKREDLRRLIVTVNYEDWGVALRGIPDDAVRKVLAELPVGMRESILESLKIQQPKEKVLEARSKVLSQVFALATKGQLSIEKPGVSSEMI